MNSNKGFAVSTVLYALLIVFLMFTLVLIASYNASSDILSSATSDLTENNSFTVRQVKPAGNVCGENGWDWYKTNTILQVKAPQGTFYWPKDWYNYDSEKGLIGNPINDDYTYNGLKAECLLDNGKYGSCNGLTLTNITNLLPYDGSATKKFKRDELEYLFKLLDTIKVSVKNNSFGTKKYNSLYGVKNFKDIIYSDNLERCDCNLNDGMVCYDSEKNNVDEKDNISYYFYDEFKEKCKPKYKCSIRTDVKYCTKTLFNEKCESSGTAIECTAKIDLSHTTETKFLYGIDENGKELYANSFIYVLNNQNNTEIDAVNFITNPSEYKIYYENQDEKNYFNVSKLKKALDYGTLSVRFSNQLNNNSREISLSNYCSD